MPDITLRGDDLGDHIATRSLKQIKGSDVASADAITLQADGNTFDVTGTTTINHITSTNWIVGSVMILHFDGAVILTNNAGGLSGAECNILLSGDVNYTTSAGDILTFLLHDSTNWQEISRNSTGYSAPTIGSTSIASGSTNATIAGLTLTTPDIGTPSAGTLTNCTGLPATTGLTATGTKDATTFLRGDDTWAVVDASPLTTKGDVYTFDTGNQRLAVGADGLVLKADSTTATGLVWGSGGGGATIVHTFSNTTNTAYLGTASSFGTVGVGDRDIYIKKIDANNEGVFTKIWKNGAAVEVQIA